MTTATVIESAVRVEKQNRRITNRYTQGNYRVRVSTQYYKKNYISRVSECKIEATDNPNIVFEVSVNSFGGLAEGDFSKQIQVVKTERYNFKTLETLQAQAVESASEIVAELLAKGKTNTQIKEAEAGK